MSAVRGAVALSLASGLLLGACTASEADGVAAPQSDPPSLQAVPALTPPEDAAVLHEEVATTGRGRLKHFSSEIGKYQLIVACVGAPLAVEVNGSHVADVACDGTQHSASVVGQPDIDQSVWIVATETTAWRVLAAQAKP